MKISGKARSDEAAAYLRFGHVTCFPAGEVACSSPRRGAATHDQKSTSALTLCSPDGSSPVPRRRSTRQCRFHPGGGAQAQRRNGQCGIGRCRCWESSRADNEEIEVVVAAHVAVEDRALWIRA